jgi:nickel/cobalt transporter (NicO) family protein
LIQIFLASLLLSVIHASIPNHLLPLIAIGKSEKWTHSEIMLGTAITGFAHTLSTVIIGIIVGVVGYKLSVSYGIISGVIAPAILIVLGIIYIILDLKGKKHTHAHFTLDKSHHHNDLDHEHYHDHSHSHVLSLAPQANKKTKWAVLSTLSLGMFLTPCIEIEAYYFQASTIGWVGIWIVSAVYTIVTVGTMMLLVYLGMKGVKNIRSHFLEAHEKRISGIVLIAVGLVVYFVEF